jgi:hypothetical protein
MAGHRQGYGRGKQRSPTKLSAAETEPLESPKAAGESTPLGETRKKHGGGRPRKASGEWGKVWLEAFRRSGNVKFACEASGVSRSCYYGWLESSPEFAASVEVARVEAIESLEIEAWRRAKHPTQPSDRLLMFLLEANAPAKYQRRDRLEVSGPGGGPIQTAGVQVTVTEERLRALQADPKGAELLKALAFRDAELMSREGGE